MPLKWDDSLSIGIEKIDIQHQELFRRINRLLDAIKNGAATEEVARTWRFLNDYVVGHFESEEQQMLAQNYPGYKSHKAEHEEFAKEFSDLKKWCESYGKEFIAVASTARLLKDWWINHITRMDMEMGAFLKKRI